MFISHESPCIKTFSVLYSGRDEEYEIWDSHRGADED